MRFFCHPTCSTCKKARRWLHEHGIVFQEDSLLTAPPSVEDLTEWIAQSGRTPRTFFNTSGQLYRELDLKNKLPSMSDAEQIALLASNGMLIKRPLLVAETGQVFSGFKDVQYETLLS